MVRSVRARAVSSVVVVVIVRGRGWGKLAVALGATASLLLTTEPPLGPGAMGRVAAAAEPAREAGVPYLFLTDLPADPTLPQPAEALVSRFAPPPGSTRLVLSPTSFGAWLRRLPLFPAGYPVHLFNGAVKPRQNVHAAVVVLDVGKRDLQQCADAVMRLRAEYLLARGEPQHIAFHPDPGKPTTLAYHGHTRADFTKYLTRVFVDAGSASLQAELLPVRGPVQPGDVLIQGGHPGHAIQVLDVAEGAGKRYLLLGQSYMPAQQFHVLNNLGAAALSPWFDEADLDRLPGLFTPEWLPFSRKDVRRFPPLTGID